MAIHEGDIVARKSYDGDVFFRIVTIYHDRGIAELSGEDLRLYADAPLDDLELVSEEKRKQKERRYQQLEHDSNRLFHQDYQLLKSKREYTSSNAYRASVQHFEMPGRVLHIDGDPNYLKKCLRVYDKLGVPVIGKHVKETDMPDAVPKLVKQVRPDILVLTGHDAYVKSKGPTDDIKAYRHSSHFIRTVKEVRYHVSHLDQLVIFAGACQSHFEKLIRAGANFASSPSRINIHALDPVYLVAKISFTSFTDQVHVWDVVRNTMSGTKGLGGVETRGILRTGMPYHDPPQ
ncbi:sporulation peptidase YabG [Tuberibacillus sp. Marseille-P3662]|uniref:sporulation peptidase YabG n=1 Tax=Tuberibacillus sp. Marseille-P3662 TaxID=1965358 RepID=UPI000A1CC0C6|nr:sporulation peptidase YabG [Tuberibacillus sp. Marseille-P3662]